MDTKEKKIGRPGKSEADLDKLCKQIEDWAEKEDSFAIRGFAAEIKVTPDLVRQWAYDYPRFRYSYQHAKNVIGLRREKNALTGVWKNPGLAERTHGQYDAEYVEFLRLIKQLDQDGILDKAITLVREVKSSQASD